MSFGEKYASQDQTSFFSHTTSIFENSCLGSLNWNIHHWVQLCYIKVYCILHMSIKFVKFISNRSKCDREFLIYNNVSQPVPKSLMSFLDEEAFIRGFHFKIFLRWHLHIRQTWSSEALQERNDTNSNSFF